MGKIQKVFIASIITIIAAAVVCVFITKKVTEREINKSIILRLSEVHSEDYPTTLACKEFARLVSEKSNGRIKIEIYSNSVLFEDESDAIIALQNGEIDFARVSSSPLANFVPRLNIIQLPFLYRDKEHQNKILFGSVGNYILQSIESANVGLVGLCFYNAGSRSFYFREKVETLEQLENLKIRVQNNPMMEKFCEVLGAKGVSGIGTSEVYKMILNGTIDGAENNLPTYQNMGDYQAAFYYMRDEHVRTPDIIVASSKSLKNLNPSDVELIKQAAKETVEYQCQKWDEKEREAERIIKKAGNTIIELPKWEIEKFRNKIFESDIYDEYKKNYGELLKVILEENTKNNF